MPSWSSTVSHAIPTDGQTDRKPGEAVDCGGRGDQRVHGQNEKMLREGGPLNQPTCGPEGPARCNSRTESRKIVNRWEINSHAEG